jgi:hypothetical protein
MTQTLITPSIVARIGLPILENNCVWANLVHRDYADEFQKVGSTVTIRKPASFTATAFSTTIAVQEVVESSVQVVMDTILDVSFELTAKELSLDIVSLQNQVLEPAFSALAQKVDSTLAALYTNIAGHATSGATVSPSDIANIGLQLDLQKCPPRDRRLVLHPYTKARYSAMDAFLHADKRGEMIGIKEAELGHVMGFDCFMDQNQPRYDSGITDTAGVMSGAATAGATAATIGSLTNAEVVAAGDVFKVAGSDKGYLIVTGATVGSTVAVVTFTPALDAAIASAAVVTFQGDTRVSMAFHKNAFALVTRPLEPPLGGAQSSYANYKGLSCRVVFAYNSTSKKNTCSIDMLLGVKTLDKDYAARFCDAN